MDSTRNKSVSLVKEGKVGKISLSTVYTVYKDKNYQLNSCPMLLLSSKRMPLI